MLKKFRLSRLKARAEQLIALNGDAFDKYDAEVVLIAKSNHLNTQVRNDIEYIIAYGIECRFEDTEYNFGILHSVNKITFCMNSIYEIAEKRNDDPFDVLERTITLLAQELRSGIHGGAKLAVKLAK